jgi:hypothetical protein
MSLTAALLRSQYIRTLRRHVAPRLGWCVRGYANTNSGAPASSQDAAARGAEVPFPASAPRQDQSAQHGAASHNGGANV